MFEYTTGRFLNPKRIIAANIYEKKTGQTAHDGSEAIEIRVAIDMDTASAQDKCVYAGPFEGREKAKEFIKSIPN